MHLEILRKLRSHLEQHPWSFPATDDELELKVLDHLFTDDQAALAMVMTAKGESAEDIAKRYGKSVKEVVDILETMAKKGAIYKEKNRYSLAAYAPGIYEFQVKALNEDMAALYDAIGAKSAPKFYSNKTAFSRTIPVESALPNNIEIAPFERASEIIKTSETIALADCVCRTKKGLLKKPCSRPRDEICIILNGWADFYIENDLARKVTVDEALKAIKRGYDAGLVHQASNYRNSPIFMCQCCSCCCGIMKSFTILDLPTALVKSNYTPVIDRETCTDCGACIKICPTGSLSLTESHLVWDPKRCIGCGLCTRECPTEAITLKKKSPAEITVPPVDLDELLTIVAHETGRTYWYK